MSTVVSTPPTTGRREFPPGISPIPDPPIRTLKVELLSQNSTAYVPLIPNSRDPTPFETEFFKGHAMLMIRTKPIDQYFNNFFEGRKRMFEVQVQGKFKREPAGEIFVGAEAQSRLELGLLTRSIANGAMKLAGTMAQDLHYHFGDPPSDPNHQLPHVVAPMFTTFDKIIVTPPGETPPVLGVPYTEDIEYRKKRLKFKNIKDAEVKLDHMYSFSVNTSNLDLLCWTLMGIPMVKPMDLRVFFGSSPIQLIAYEIPYSVITKFPNAHPYKLLSYVFSMRLTPVDPDSMPIIELPGTMSSDDDGEEEEPVAAPSNIPAITPAAGNESLPMHTIDNTLGVDDDDRGADATDSDEEEGEGDQIIIADLQSPYAQSKKNRGSVRGWLKKKFTRKGHKEGNASSGTAVTGGAVEDETMDLNESSEYVSPDYESESIGDLSYCPACIEINDPRNPNKRRYCYVLPLPENVMVDPSIESSVASIYNVRSPRLRTYSEIAKAIPLMPVPKMHKNKRMSSLELRRRQVVESVKTIFKNGVSKDPVNYKKLVAFITQVTEIDGHFLNGNVPVLERINPKDSEISWEGYVSLALSRRHFIEYYMILTKEHVIMKKHADVRNSRSNYCLVIPLKEIASIQILPQDQCPMSDFGFFQIETVTKVYYLMVKTDMQLTDWMQGFITLLGNNCMCSRFRADYRDKFGLNNNDSVAFTLDVDEIYLAKPACYKLDKRRVYNYRKIQFRTGYWGRSSSATISANNAPSVASLSVTNINGNGSAPSSSSSATTAASPNEPHPNDLVAQCLTTAFQLVTVETAGKSTEYDWVKFWDEISLLQTVNLYRLTETERMAFFLNLYHVMVLHASLVYGPPTAWSQWNAFFNQIAYVVGCELFSIAEIEYCILRAAMSRSPMFTAVAMVPPPQTVYPTLALTQRDFRLHFAINNGSSSYPDEIPIYYADRLDAQLDEITRIAVETFIDVDVIKKTVSMPKLPSSDYQIHRHDGNAGVASKTSSGSSVDCLAALTPYLSKTKKSALLPLLFDAQHLNIKHKNLNFRCRLLRKLQNSTVPLAGNMISSGSTLPPSTSVLTTVVPQAPSDPVMA